MTQRKTDAQRCRGCVYWKKLSGSGYSAYACHFLLKARRARRKDADGRCLEFQKKRLQNEKYGV